MSRAAYLQPMFQRIVAAIFVIGLLSAILTPPADAGERSRSARAEFVKANPCPPPGSPLGPVLATLWTTLCRWPVAG